MIVEMKLTNEKKNRVMFFLLLFNIPVILEKCIV